jgi:membrane carboxypeptidase/penicillin-binding protein
VDRAAFYQLKTMMQGVLARGTAHAISGLAPYVAGKTGTSDEENDAWFVGFTNDVTVAVWLGYDNATGKRRTLGSGATGGGVAVPIFEPIIHAVWANVAPKTALSPPSPEAKRQLSCKSVDLESGEVQSGRKAVTECLRMDGKGRVVDTQYRLVSRGDTSAVQGIKEPRVRPSVRIAKPIRPMPAPSNQAPSSYDTRYGWDNNGRYTYQPDFWRGSSQPNPQTPPTNRYQRADPFWSNR